MRVSWSWSCGQRGADRGPAGRPGVVLQHDVLRNGCVLHVLLAAAAAWYLRDTYRRGSYVSTVASTSFAHCVQLNLASRQLTR
jgi:hypothetical protein